MSSLKLSGFGLPVTGEPEMSHPQPDRLETLEVVRMETQKVDQQQQSLDVNAHDFPARNVSPQPTEVSHTVAA